MGGGGDSKFSDEWWVNEYQLGDVVIVDENLQISRMALLIGWNMTGLGETHQKSLLSLHFVQAQENGDDHFSVHSALFQPGNGICNVKQKSWLSKHAKTWSADFTKELIQ